MASLHGTGAVVQPWHCIRFHCLHENSPAPLAESCHKVDGLCDTWHALSARKTSSHGSMATLRIELDGQGGGAQVAPKELCTKLMDAAVAGGRSCALAPSKG